MRRARFGRLLVAMAAVGAAAVMASGSRPQPSQRALTPVTRVVEIRAFRFVPDTLAVSLGDTIQWVNRDPVPHTATAADSSWDSGRLEPDQTGILVVESGSQPRYVCAYHPTMIGVLRLSSRHPPPGGERRPPFQPVQHLANLVTYQTYVSRPPARRDRARCRR